MRDERGEGFEEGYAAGRRDCRDVTAAHYRAGLKKGYRDGYNAGWSEGYGAGYFKGRDDGAHFGHEIGLDGLPLPEIAYPEGWPYKREDPEPGQQRLLHDPPGGGTMSREEDEAYIRKHGEDPSMYRHAIRRVNSRLLFIADRFEGRPKRMAAKLVGRLNGSNSS